MKNKLLHFVRGIIVETFRKRRRVEDPIRMRAEKYEQIVKTDDPSTCPRCGSTDVAWCGGDMDGHGGYYHMYLCEDCGRLPEGGVRVFLVSCSKEDYGHGCDFIGIPGQSERVHEGDQEGS